MHASTSGRHGGETAAAAGGKKRKASAGSDKGGSSAADETDSKKAGASSTGRKAAWIDPEDAALVVDVSGGSRLRKLRARDDQKTMGGGWLRS